jgi:hypothetical protein
MRALPLLAASLVIATGAFADDSKQTNASTEKSGNDCLFFRTVEDWRVLDDQHLVVWALGRNEAYLIETTLSVWGLKTQEQLAFIDRNRDGRLCSFGGDAIATTANAGFNESATIASIRRVDEPALEQLSAQYEVKLTRKAPKDEAKAAADSN